MNTKYLIPRAIKTLDDLRSTVAEAAQLNHRIEILEETEQIEVDAVRRVYGGEKATLKKSYDALVKKLTIWAKSNRGEFSGQSYVIDGHCLKYRQSPGKLVSDSKPDANIEAILATGDESFIEAVLNYTPSEDKQTIKALLESGGPHADLLTSIGYRVVKGETFVFKAASSNS